MCRTRSRKRATSTSTTSARGMPLLALRPPLGRWPPPSAEAPWTERTTATPRPRNGPATTLALHLRPRGRQSESVKRGLQNGGRRMRRADTAAVARPRDVVTMRRALTAALALAVVLNRRPSVVVKVANMRRSRGFPELPALRLGPVAAVTERGGRCQQPRLTWRS